MAEPEFGVRYQRSARPGDVVTYYKGEWVPKTPFAPAVTSAVFPVGPIDGQEFYYQAATGVYWHFKYDATNAYWNFVGGSPMFGVVDAAISNSLSSTWQDTVTPNVTLPFAGDYSIQVEALVNNSTANANVEFGFCKNAATGFPTRIWNVAGAVAGTSWTGNVVSDHVGLAKNDLMSIQIFTSNAVATNTNFQFRSIRVQPIRVH